MTMRISCTELHSVTRSFGLLLGTCQRFMKVHLLPPILSACVASLTAAFDLFCQQVVALCSTFRRSAATRTFTPVSPIYQAAEVFTTKWTEFIEIINQIAAHGVLPYEIVNQHAFGCLLGVLSIIEVRMRRKCFIGREVLQFTTKARKHLVGHQQRLSEILMMSEERVHVEFDAKRYGDFFHRHLLEMNAVLDLELPADIFTPVEKGKLKMDVSVACASLGQIARSIGVFHGNLVDMRAQIVDLNVRLAQLHESLSLPFAVVLTVEDHMAPSVAGDA
jgi:hypothetical protein